MARRDHPSTLKQATAGAFDTAVAQRLAQLEDAHMPRRIWDRDPTVWKDDPGTREIADRLGWLTVAGAMLDETATLAAFAAEIRDRKSVV